MEDPNNLNIPAFKRRRSIMAQEKKTNFEPSTTLPKKVRVKKTVTTIRKRATKKQLPEYRPYSSSFNSNGKIPTIEELSIKPTTTTNNFFSSPFIPEPAKSSKVLREMKKCGICEGYYDKIEVAIIRVTSAIRVGDNIIFEKNDGLFEQKIDSMQIDRHDVQLATTGSEIGLKVEIKPVVGSTVYKVI
ncbi:MAG: hypothetical protein AAB373_01890 [Patescibacteria group bacterium]